MPLCSSPYADAQMVGLMGLTASGLPARMRRNARRRLAEARTTYSCAGTLEKPQDLGSTMPSDQAPDKVRAQGWHLVLGG